MNICKKRISLILSLVMLALTILPIFIVNAASSITISAKLGSETMNRTNTYNVEGGEKITISTTSSSDTTVSLIGYYWDNNSTAITQVNANTVTVTVPTGATGTTKELHVAAAGLNTANENVQALWVTYKLSYGVAPVEGKAMTVKYNGVTLVDKTVLNAALGDSLVIKATPSDSVKEMYYKWDSTGDWMVVKNASTYILDFPSTFTAGSTHYLYTKAKFTDDVICDSVSIKFIMVDDESQVSMDVTIDGRTMTEGNTYEVEGGETIRAVADSTVADIAYVGYYYSDNTKIVDQYGDTLTFTVPTKTAGTSIKVYIEAVAENDDGTPNTRTKTGWISYTLKYVADPVETKDLYVTYEGNKLIENSTTDVNPGESIKIVTSPANKVLKTYFKWDSNSWSVINNTAEYSTRIPTEFVAGSTHYLYVKAEYTDGTVISQKVYKFYIPETASQITMNVKIDSKTITAGNTYEVEGGEEVVVTASATNTDVNSIKYSFGSESTKNVNGSKATFDVPDKSKGTSLKLYVEAIGDDGSTTGKKTYTLKFVDTKDGDLDIEPWMEENDELAELSINLRNDSEEEDKANKNIYELGEVVTYFIDYKNGTGEDIDSEVTIELELPLDFSVVSKGDGVVDSSDNLITWTFEDGLEEDEAGTLVVKIKYTDFSKSKYDSETIYPSASISQKSKEKDRSTVINFIISEYDEELDVTHEPYMFGDEYDDTFRPNDGITRAEGALVLARIYGLNYESVKVDYNVFADLDETYLEAQKAILAATKAGLINGYSNGLYRPNVRMTKAEFMKILACMVEENAEDEDIEGLEIKDVESLIKVYEDSTRYYIVDGKKVYSHWAIEEVTLLARLNMTPLTEDEDEIELDEEITRAEVAQLVNFYLLRAPANITSKTKSDFSDVTKKHDLFADIIEATRDEHEFSISEEDATEIEE